MRATSLLGIFSWLGHLPTPNRVTTLLPLCCNQMSFTCVKQMLCMKLFHPGAWDVQCGHCTWSKVEERTNSDSFKLPNKWLLWKRYWQCVAASRLDVLCFQRCCSADHVVIVVTSSYFNSCCLSVVSNRSAHSDLWPLTTTWWVFFPPHSFSSREMMSWFQDHSLQTAEAVVHESPVQ